MMMICLESSSKRNTFLTYFLSFLHPSHDSEKHLSEFQTFLSREHSRFANIFNAKSIYILLFESIFFTQNFLRLLLLFIHVIYFFDMNRNAKKNP